jgi:transcriptional regulator with GAF, ATPase, and Fis domain
MAGHPIADFLSSESAARLRRLSSALEDDPQGRHYLWVPGGLQAQTLAGAQFPSEASIARFESKGQPFYTIILRNINDRLESEQRIEALARETAYLREEIDAVFHAGNTVGASPPMRALRASVQQVAPTNSTVLILGESGTGKELTARAIHAASRRADKPLVRVNCAAIPASLIESEFFGHEKGAFTGATAKREGRFALADGGTIFLDEIGELPIDLQPKLLRVLQEGEFEPVGSAELRTADVRVIAATNRDLKQAIADGRFREDLYYRLNVFPVVVPPLRERGDDIVVLAETFADSLAKEIGRSLQPFSPDDVARLKAYRWPGNVRELRNVIERAVITAVDGRMCLAGLIETAPPIDAPVASDSHENGHVLTVDEFRGFERANIIRALEQCDWKVSGAQGAAALMKIAPSNLFSRIKALKIERGS